MRPRPRLSPPRSGRPLIEATWLRLVYAPSGGFSPLVGFGQRHPVFRRLATHQAPARRGLFADHADGHTARLGFDATLFLGIAAPLRPRETALLPEVGDHLVQRL